MQKQLFAISLLSASLAAQTIYTNGTYVTSPGESLLQTANPPLNLYGTGVQFATATTSNSCVDDFTVCGTWQANTVEYPVYQTGNLTGTSTITAAYIRIYNRDPRLAASYPPPAGEIVWDGYATPNAISSNLSSGVFRRLAGTAVDREIYTVQVPLGPGGAGIVLNPGVYWIECSFSGTLASGPWMPPIVELGQGFTGNGSQRIGGTGVWQDMLSGTAPNTFRQGIPFTVQGVAPSIVYAAASVYGTGKTGTNGVAAWDLGPTPIRTPKLGAEYPLRIVNGAAGAVPILALGTPIPTGFPFAPVGTIYVTPIATIGGPAFDANNVMTLRLPVPHGQNLCGAVLGVQGVWADAGAAGGIGHSDGLSMTLGN